MANDLKTHELVLTRAGDKSLLLSYNSSGRYNWRVVFSQLAQFTDVALLLLRVIVGIVFITSGWNHVKDPEARSKTLRPAKVLRFFWARLSRPEGSEWSLASSLNPLPSV
jgi:hypothetical protein